MKNAIPLSQRILVMKNHMFSTCSSFAENVKSCESKSDDDEFLNFNFRNICWFSMAVSVQLLNQTSVLRVLLSYLDLQN
jgi:hypothetical protein